MNPKINVLLVEDNADAALLVRHSLSVSRQAAFQVKVVGTLADARQALGRERFDAVLLDLNLPDGRGIETFTRVQDVARDLVIIILTAVEDESVATDAISRGAADYLIKGELGGEGLARRVRFAIERSKAKAAGPGSKSARVITVLGSKGGVGASTMAINLAAVSTRKDKKAVLLELRECAGSLAAMLGVNPPHTLGSLAQAGGTQTAASALIDLSFGARLLSAPTSLEPGSWDENLADTLIPQLAGMAETVVIDASLQMPKLARAAVSLSAFTVLVVDREAVSVQVAGAIAQSLNNWAARPNSVGVALVTHAPSVDSAPLAEIRRQLNLGLVGVIPPARDALQSYRRMGPIVLSQPQLPVAQAFEELAARLEQDPVRFTTA
jgi:DNA-binding response OmpR family regulator